MAFNTNSQSIDLLGIPIPDIYSKESNTFPALQAVAGAFIDSFNNPSSAAVISPLRPMFVQSNHAVTGGAGKTLTCAFNSNNFAGNSIVVSVGMGEVEGANITLTITDTNSNTYTQAVKASQSTTLESAIFIATKIASGANTITVTIAGSSSSNTAIAVEIYEAWGFIALSPSALDQTATGSNAGSTSVSTAVVMPLLPNELAFVAISTAGGTITAGANATLDSGSLSPIGGNLVSFGAESYQLSTITPLSPSATLSGSNAWSACCATFKSIAVPITGTVVSQPVQGIPTESVVSVGTGSTSVLVANPNRKFLLLINDSNNTIYLSIGGNTAVLNTGQRLNANGGSLLLDAYVATSAINAIATAASSNLLVTAG